MSDNLSFLAPRPWCPGTCPKLESEPGAGGRSNRSWNRPRFLRTSFNSACSRIPPIHQRRTVFSIPVSPQALSGTRSTGRSAVLHSRFAGDHQRGVSKVSARSGPGSRNAPHRREINTHRRCDPPAPVRNEHSQDLSQRFIRTAPHRREISPLHFPHRRAMDLSRFACLSPLVKP